MIDEELLDKMFDCVLTLNECEFIVDEDECELLQQAQLILNRILEENDK